MTWILDMNSEEHKCKDIFQLEKGTYEEKNGNRTLKGYIPWKNKTGKIMRIPIENVNVTPGIENNVLSLQTILNKGFTIQYINENCEIWRRDQFIINGIWVNNRYEINEEKQEEIINFREKVLKEEEENRIAKSNEIQKQIDKLKQLLLNAEKRYLVQEEELKRKNKDLNDQLIKVSFLEERISNLLSSQQHAYDPRCDLNETEKMVTSTAIIAIAKKIDDLQNCFGNFNEQQTVECLESIYELNHKQKEYKHDELVRIEKYEKLIGLNEICNKGNVLDLRVEFANRYNIEIIVFDATVPVGFDLEFHWSTSTLRERDINVDKDDRFFSKYESDSHINYMDNSAIKEKKQFANNYNLQPRTDEQMWLNQLNGIILHFLQAWFADRIIEEQQRFLGIQRQAIAYSIFKEIMQLYLKTKRRCSLINWKTRKQKNAIQYIIYEITLFIFDLSIDLEVYLQLNYFTLQSIILLFLIIPSSLQGA